MARGSKSGKSDTKGKTRREYDDSPRPRKAAGILAWGMLALVILGLGGFGITNFGGGVHSIGSVGGESISTTDYAHALRQELQAVSSQSGQDVSMKQARQMGLDRDVLRRLVTTAALNDEDRRLGISVGDTRLRQEVTAMKAFQGADGKFDPNSYKFVLKQNGLTPAEFEGKVRNQMARSILQEAVASGFEAPKAYVDTLLGYIGARRGFDILKITPADLKTPVPAPTEAELQAYYKAHPKTYTSPKAKRITYAALTPDMLADTVKVDDKTLHDLYQKNIGDYVKPARRLVERLVYPTEAAAKAAKARLDAGKATFEQLVKARGLDLSDIDMGDVTKDQLGKAGAAVFAAKNKSVVGPVQTDLGPALFRVNGIIAAETTTFEQAKPDLLSQLQSSRAADEISNRIEHIDDLLAGGATLEDLAKDTKMQLGHIDYTAKTTDGIAAYEAFRKAADKVTTDDYPSIIQLQDGGIVAIRLDKVVPPALIPFAKVRARVAADWTKAATDKALMARAQDVVRGVEGGKALDFYGNLDEQEPIERSGYIEGAPAGLLDKVFAMKKGGVAAVGGDKFVWVVQVTSVLAPDATDPDTQKLRAQLTARGSQGLSNDAFVLFATGLEDKAGIKLNQAAINAVNAQFH